MVFLDRVRGKKYILLKFFVETLVKKFFGGAISPAHIGECVCENLRIEKNFLTKKLLIYVSTGIRKVILFFDFLSQLR